MAVTRSRKFLLLIIALVLLADFLPVTREEFAWWWAESRDHAADYLRYIGDYPHNGRHLVEARNRYEERQRAETIRAQIRKAASEVNLKTDAADKRALRVRRENFFWKQAITANTIESYNDYLREFPQGSYAPDARARIRALTQARQGQ